MQFTESAEWVKAWNIYYKLGIDGISVLFVALTALLTVISIMVSWTAIQDRVREFMVAMLFLEAAMVGVFVAMDLFLFYIFWEAMLIPMYLLIGIWGGPNRLYAAIKFFLYTLVGSVLMLIAIIAVYIAAGNTFDVLAIMNHKFSYTFQMLAFAAFFAAFAVKVPMFPVHTWLPDAHVEAPTAGSIILAGILIKMGAYGFLRFSLPFFPDAAIAWTPAIMVLSVIAIIYGAYMAFAQTDFKKLIAYSSVSHMGFVTLGIFALNSQGLEGGILQMLNHGVSTGALFLAVGVIYERTHTQADRRLRRHRGQGPGVCHVPADHHAFVHRSAGDERVHRGVHDPARAPSCTTSLMRSSRRSASSWARATCSGFISGWPSARSRTRITSTWRT